MSDVLAGAIENLAERVRHLESLEYIAHAGEADHATDSDTADAITDGLIVLDVAVDADSTSYTMAAGAGVWETDPTVTQTITVPAGKTATIIAAFQARWNNTTAQRAANAGFRGILDAAAGQEAGYFANSAAADFMGVAVINYWTAVAAGAHTIALQFRRLNAGDTINVTRRVMWAVAIEE